MVPTRPPPALRAVPSTPGGAAEQLGRAAASSLERRRRRTGRRTCRAAAGRVVEVQVDDNLKTITLKGDVLSTG